MDGARVVATTANPAFAVDGEGTIIAWNQGAEYHLGYRSAEVIGRHCWSVLRGRDLFSNRYCDRSCPLRSMARQGEAINRSQMYFRDASGGSTRFSMFTVVVRTEARVELVHLLEPAAAREQGASAAGRSGRDVAAGARLSPRQLEVLTHLGEGQGTAEIAAHLCISPATVRHHIQRILRRLRVHSRLEAVVLARRIGLLRGRRGGGSP